MYVRSESTWRKEAQLDYEANSYLRGSVDLSGDMAVVGFPAYLFVWCGSTWVNTAELAPTSNQTEVDALVAESMAISGTTVVVGAPYDSEAGDKAGAFYTFNVDMYNCLTLKPTVAPTMTSTTSMPGPMTASPATPAPTDTSPQVSTMIPTSTMLTSNTSSAATMMLGTTTILGLLLLLCF